MKTKHFTYRVPPCTEKAIRLPLPAIDVWERSPVEKYRRNIVKFETTPDERRILDAARLASVTLRRTFDKWVTMGRGLQLLRKKADQIGTRNAFNDLRDQHGFGERFYNKTLVSKLLRVMDELEAVEKWRATLTQKAAIRVGVAGRYHQALPGVQPAAGRRRKAQDVGLRQA